MAVYSNESCLALYAMEDDRLGEDYIHHGGEFIGFCSVCGNEIIEYPWGTRRYDFDNLICEECCSASDEDVEDDFREEAADFIQETEEKLAVEGKTVCQKQ
jgi:hypothetical protein